MTTNKQLNSDVQKDLNEYKKTHDATSVNNAINEINQWQRQNGQNTAASAAELKQLNTQLQQSGVLPGLELIQHTPFGIQTGDLSRGLDAVTAKPGHTDLPPSVTLGVKPGSANEVETEFANATSGQEKGHNSFFADLFRPGNSDSPQLYASALQVSNDTTTAALVNINNHLKSDGSALQIDSEPNGFHTSVTNQNQLQHDIESNLTSGINNETNSNHEKANDELASANTDVQALNSISNVQQRNADVDAINKFLKGNSATNTTSLDVENGQVQIKSTSSAYEFGVENLTASSNQYVAGKIDLYDGKSWQQSIAPTGVDQGQDGDCGFESMVSSLASSTQGQEQIHNMIKPNSNGSFTVTFPGNKSNPVNVTAADLNQINQGNSNEATWSRVLEAAYMKTVNHGDLSDAYVHSNILKAPDGSDANYYLLTGKTEKTDHLVGDSSPASAKTVGADLQSNFEHGNLSVAASTPNPEAQTTSGVSNPDALSGTSITHPIVPGHSYSVVGYENGMVTVRNPWGTNSGTIFDGANGKEQAGKTVDGITDLGNGELRMSLQTFTQNFSGVETSTQGGRI